MGKEGGNHYAIRAERVVRILHHNTCTTELAVIMFMAHGVGARPFPLGMDMLLFSRWCAVRSYCASPLASVQNCSAAPSEGLKLGRMPSNSSLWGCTVCGHLATLRTAVKAVRSDGFSNASDLTEPAQAPGLEPWAESVTLASKIAQAKSLHTAGSLVFVANNKLFATRC